MGRWRLVLAGVLLAAAGMLQIPGGARAAGSVPATNFARVTPRNALFYATIQSTSARQAALVDRLGGSLTRLLTPTLQLALGQTLGTNSPTNGLAGSLLGGGTIPQVTGLLAGALSKIFNGEVGLALLPLTLTPESGTSTVPAPHVHLLLDAGLQPGISQVALLFAGQALGLTTTAATTDQGIGVVSIDINVLARTLGTLTHNTALAKGTLIPANAPISPLFYSAVLGNVLVLASDMPTLAAAIATYQHTAPSILASAAYGTATGLLPSDRFATVYLQLGGSSLVQILQPLGASLSLLPMPAGETGSGVAAGLTLEPHALIVSIATPSSLQATTLPLPALS